jgi:group I intron endonuclease
MNKNGKKKMVMYKGIIYVAISPSGKKYYGMSLKSLEKRIAGHVKRMIDGNHLKFYNALRKYGPENFIRNVIEEYEDSDKMKLKFLLYEREIYWIEKDKTYLPEFGYNISHGGTGSDIYNSLSDERKIEVKKTISDSVKQKWKDEEYRAKLIKARRTPEYHEKQSKNSKKQWENPEKRAKYIKIFRKEIWDNPERNKKISDKLKNRPKQKCKYCGFETNNASNMKRWHNENCKYKKEA